MFSMGNREVLNKAANKLLGEKVCRFSTSIVAVFCLIFGVHLICYFEL